MLDILSYISRIILYISARSNIIRFCDILHVRRHVVHLLVWIFLDISKLLCSFPGHLVFFRHFYFSPIYIYMQVSGGFEFRQPIPMRWTTTTTGHMLCMEIRYTSPCINAPHNSSPSYIDIIMTKKKKRSIIIIIMTCTVSV